MDATCQYTIPETGEACGKHASKTWGAGMSLSEQDPARPGYVGTFYFAYVCQEHFDRLSKEAEERDDGP